VRHGHSHHPPTNLGLWVCGKQPDALVNSSQDKTTGDRRDCKARIGFLNSFLANGSGIRPSKSRSAQTIEGGRTSGLATVARNRTPYHSVLPIGRGHGPPSPSCEGDGAHSRPNAKTATVAPKEKEEWLVAPSGSELAQCAGQTSKGLYASPPLSLAEAPESNRRIAQRSGKGPQRAMGSRTHGPLFSPQRGLQAR